MRSRIALSLLVASCMAFGTPARSGAQAAPAGKAKDGKAKDGKPKEEKQPTGEKTVPALWTSEMPLTLTLTTNVKQIKRDKDENAPWRVATLTFPDSTGQPAKMPIQIRTRGFYRLKNCYYPPLRLNFAGKNTKGTIWEGVDKPKLVNYCRDTDQFEQYILQELQLYRIYALLTPYSHRVRLAKVAYLDSASGKREAERWAILVEDPDQLANRHMGKIIKEKGAGPGYLEGKELAIAYLFEYLIGNLDFSFAGLHNTELLGLADGRVIPIAYDFDYSGAVNTTYAVPPAIYNVPNVRTRKFLGYCANAEDFPAARALFLEKKDAIYALYRDEIGKLLGSREARSTIEYFDDFYEQIRTPQDAERNVFKKCQGPK
jgi:hypothetical protein